MSVVFVLIKFLFAAYVLLSYSALYNQKVVIEGFPETVPPPQVENFPPPSPSPAETETVPLPPPPPPPLVETEIVLPPPPPVKMAPSPPPPLVNTDTVSLPPVIVFAHGAGGNSSSDFMVKWKSLISKAINAVEVVTFNYPFASGSKEGVVPKPEAMMSFHKKEVEKAMASHPGHPLVLIGKSFGCRVSSFLAGEDDCPAKALVCLTYPLKGARDGAIREKPLVDVKRPVLLVQGSKDPLCPLGLLDNYIPQIKVDNSLHVMEGGDHSLTVSAQDLAKMNTSQEALDLAAVSAISSFLESILS